MAADPIARAIGHRFIEEIDRGILDRFLATPLHRSSMIVGRVSYEALSLVIQASIIGGLAWLMGAEFGGGLGGYAMLVACGVLIAATFGSLSNASACCSGIASRSSA